MRAMRGSGSPPAQRERARPARGRIRGFAKHDSAARRTAPSSSEARRADLAGLGPLGRELAQRGDSCAGAAATPRRARPRAARAGPRLHPPERRQHLRGLPRRSPSGSSGDSSARAGGAGSAARRKQDRRRRGGERPRARQLAPASRSAGSRATRSAPRRTRAAARRGSAGTRRARTASCAPVAHARRPVFLARGIAAAHGAARARACAGAGTDYPRRATRARRLDVDAFDHDVDGARPPRTAAMIGARAQPVVDVLAQLAFGSAISGPWPG
jgi:hypothetical protein